MSKADKEDEKLPPSLTKLVVVTVGLCFVIIAGTHGLLFVESPFNPERTYYNQGSGGKSSYLVVLPLLFLCVVRCIYLIRKRLKDKKDSSWEIRRKRAKIKSRHFRDL